jgi:hypothetical protein
MKIQYLHYLFAEYLNYNLGVKTDYGLEYEPEICKTIQYSISFKTYLKWRFGSDYHKTLCDSWNLKNNELARKIADLQIIYDVFHVEHSFSNKFYLQ